MGKFSLEKAVPGNSKKEEKRPSLEQASGLAKKFKLSVSDVIEEHAPMVPKGSTRKFAAHAPVEVIIRKYTASRPCRSI